MSRQFVPRPATRAAGVVTLAVAVTTALTGTATAVTTTTAVTHPCVGGFYFFGNNKIDTVPGTGSPATDTVTGDAPTGVAPGEVYTVQVAPGMMATGGVGAGRMSYDLAVPAGATLLRAAIVDPGQGLTGTPRADQITASAAADPAGPYLRVWGGGNPVGANNSVTGIGTWKDGLQAAPNSAFRMPAVALTLRAGARTAGQNLPVGFAKAGTTASTGDAVSAFRGMEPTGLTSEAEDVFYCSASANGASLAATRVDGARPVHQAVTSTAMVTGDTTVLTGSGATALTAAVSSDEETVAHLRAGTMRLVVTDAVTGTTVAAPSGLAIGADGRATASVSLPALGTGEVRHAYRVRAEYSGVTGDIAPSASTADSTVTVAYREHPAVFALSSTNGAVGAASMPVTVSGKLSFADGAALPSGAKVQLLRDGVALGAPVAVGSGGTFAFPTDAAPRQAATTQYVYSVRYVETRSGLDRYFGESADPVAAIVTGTNPEGTIPGGGFGVPGSSDLVTDPGASWRWLGDSVGSAGEFSTTLGGANR